MSGGGTPRQQMIGLMYLVLLAMLAMNASKDLLNAFVMLERGIDKTVKNFTEKNQQYYTVIESAAAKLESAKVSLEKANKIKDAAQELYDQIEEDKNWLINTTGGKDADSIPLSKDNQDIGSTYYSVLEGGKNGERLKKMVDDYRALIIETLDTDGITENDYLKEEYKEILSTEEKPDPHDKNIKLSWIDQMTSHLPMASVTANLTLWQSYVRNAEADVVSSLASVLEGEGIVVNKVEGMAAFESGYVLKGDTLKSEIFISAYNSNITPKVYQGIIDTNKLKDGHMLDKTAKAAPPIIGEATPIEVSGGKGNFNMPANEVGAGVLQGVIGIPSQKGIDYYPFKQGYMIAEPTATIAASKMNVIYVGVDNPMQISAPGVSVDEIEISAPGISFRADPKVPGGYIAKASRANPRGTPITVKKKDGTKLASSDFRVKRLPDPVASVLGEKEGIVSRGKLKAASFVKAEMENFDFEANVRVTSFKMTVSMGGDLTEYTSNSATLTAQMRNLLANVGIGDRIYFEEIKVKMPDGSTRKVPSIILKAR